ncbi:hypothetical protein Bca52824_025631 [Brassica carinata]|uniref:Uncharacterized protein n=1 Tax=Brassica carinata TaxID=52824 RepID=A0A8X7SGJ6_BRACI|nr:hypothetical protein Bca52824_025631 [Brassica carinata]
MVEMMKVAIANARGREEENGGGDGAGKRRLAHENYVQAENLCHRCFRVSGIELSSRLLP